MRPSQAPPAPAILLGLVLLICSYAAWVRMGHDQRVWRIAELSEVSGTHDQQWFSDEPDGLYHMRRVQRSLNEGELASRDSKLNAPDGAAIPWPPYADQVHAALLAPFAPGQPGTEQDRYIETRMAWMPFAWSLLSCAAIVVAAAVLFRSLIAAALAGVMFAGQYAAAHYSAPGIADHHAWVSLLNTATLLACMFAWRDGLTKVKSARVWGIAAGVLMALSLGSWVASLLWLLGLQLTLGLMLLVDRKHALPGLRAFGLCFHLAAAVVLLPAAWASPWQASHPWMVVNLSWFHPAQLLLGALCFAVPRPSKLHPWLLPLGIVGAAGFLFAFNIGPGAGIREGFAWVSRGDEFMSGIAESEPLLGSEQGSFLKWASWSFFLLPLAWLGLVLQVRRDSNLALLPLLVLLPLAALQTWTQIRFAEALAPLMALTAAASVAAIARIQSVETFLARVPQVAQAACACLMGVALVPDGVLHRTPGPHQDLARNAHRSLVEWVGQQSSPDTEEQSVLAPWDWGHAIEWSTPFASVATNFGSYVGEAGYRAPARFFLATDATQARQVLDRHQVRYVIRPSRIILSLEQLQRSYGAGLRPGGFVTAVVDEKGRSRSQFNAAWSNTMAAVLGLPAYPSPSGIRPGLGDLDGPDGSAQPIDFLRLVALSPAADDHPGLGGVTQPFGLVWEHVNGAQITTTLAPGQKFEVELGISMQVGGQRLLDFLYRSSEAGDSNGVATIGVPYNTALNNGQATVETAQWRILDQAGNVVSAGELFVSEEAVQLGTQVRVGD